jgi:hypothetical protein
VMTTPAACTEAWRVSPEPGADSTIWRTWDRAPPKS